MLLLYLLGGSGIMIVVINPRMDFEKPAHGGKLKQ